MYTANRAYCFSLPASQPSKYPLKRKSTDCLLRPGEQGEEEEENQQGEKEKEENWVTKEEKVEKSRNKTWKKSKATINNKEGMEAELHCVSLSLLP